MLGETRINGIPAIRAQCKEAPADCQWLNLVSWLSKLVESVPFDPVRLA